jgi:C1A family cysteine protease
MKAFALLAGCTSYAAATPADKPDYNSMWLQFKGDYNKQYDSNGGDEQKRFEVFKANVDIIEEHNAKKLSYRLGVNEFTDLTWDEFSSTHLGYAGKSSRLGEKAPFPLNITAAATESVDWVDKGAVTPVKNQQRCGSCWAFSATGAIEGAYFVASGKLLSLSEEDLVQCVGGDHGCRGGLMDNAFNFVQKNGIASEADYPYTSGGGYTGSCNGGLEHRPAVQITGHTDVPSGNENALKLAVSHQPVSVAIEADRSTFQHYRGGILDNPACGKQLDHGVLVVGYGTDKGKDYWKVKNSWGGSWGEHGYIRMVRNKDQCGISSEPSYPTGAKAAPAPVPPTPAPPMPTGCKVTGPSYTIDQSCKGSAGLQRGVKDAAACAALCKASSNCTAFHYYGIGDFAYGDCYLHQAGIIKGPLQDGRDRYAGTCGEPKPCPEPPMPEGCTVKGPSYTIDGNCPILGAWPLKGVKDATACASRCKYSSAIGAKCAAFHYYGVDDRAWGDCYLHSCAGTIKGPLHDGRDRYAGTCKNTFSNRQGVQFV